MRTDRFEKKGIEFSYELDFWGNIKKKIFVELGYNENGDPLFTNESLMQLRDFLYHHTAFDISFNVEGCQEEYLGNCLGSLAKSLPNLKIVEFTGCFTHYIDKKEVIEFAARKHFDTLVAEILETSLSQPSSVIGVSSLIKDQTDSSKIYQNAGYSHVGTKAYSDKRTSEQHKLYDHLNRPHQSLLSKIFCLGIRKAASLYYGDTERAEFINCLTEQKLTPPNDEPQQDQGEPGGAYAFKLFQLPVWDASNHERRGEEQLTEEEKRKIERSEAWMSWGGGAH